MNIIKLLKYAFMTAFNCMPVKTFKQLCECYAYDFDESVEPVIADYIASHVLSNTKHFHYDEGRAFDAEFFKGSKLEVICNMKSNKLWSLLSKCVGNRPLSSPEQYALVEYMPAEYFCLMYKNKAEKIDWFCSKVGIYMIQNYKKHYDKLVWYVQNCALGKNELSRFSDMFVRDVERYKDKAEQEKSFCALMLQWMSANNAPEDSFNSYGKMLDFCLTEIERLVDEQIAD